MRRRARHVLAVIAAVLAGPLLGALALASPALASPALAEPARAASGPTSLTIEGPGLTKPLNVVAATDSELFADLLGEVGWLATRPPNAPTPDPATLGPAYQMVVRVDAVPDQTYTLYPLAKGGPRVFRPAEQPKGKKVNPAWFYGRISMPDTMRLAGVPLDLTTGGGQGGGGAVGAGIITRAPAENDFDSLLGEWRKQVALMGAGSLVLLALLGTFVRLVRKP
jgi:hypothetical protein